jgi:hypothetical protein
MDTDKIPFYLRKLGETVENKVSEAFNGKSSDASESSDFPAMRPDGMNFMEPDWDDIDRKADFIVGRYAVVSAAMNILPMPFDVMGVTGTFAKMATELAGVYQVIVSNKRARQMGWAIATTTASVLGVAYTGSRLAKFIPGGYWIATAVQAPIVGAIAWAAGDALKNYFKQCRMGREPSIQSLSESFGQTLHLRLKKVKVADVPAPTTVVVPMAPPAVLRDESNDAMEQIAMLHELMRSGAITQAEFDQKKTQLLSRI